MPFPALQSMFDELIPKGLQWYWRGDFFDTVSDAAIEVHQRYGENIPTELSTMHLYPVDGAAHQVGTDDTAWAYRDAVWSGVIGGIDPDPVNADLIRQWCVDYWNDLHPHSIDSLPVRVPCETNARHSSSLIFCMPSSSPRQCPRDSRK